MTRSRVLLAALVLAAPAAAQCSNLSGVAFTSYGAGCSALFQTPAVSGSYDAAACTISFTLTHSPSCCNTYLTGRILIFGGAPVQVPIPFLTCDLLVVPETIMEFMPSGSDVFTLQIPNVPLAGLTLYLQGANVFFTTIGFSYDFEVSNGLQISAF